MADAKRSVRDSAIVPDVTGLPFPAARDVARAAGVVLANPDPDGPPIAALAWPGDFSVVRQDPAPGTILLERDSVKVWLAAEPGGAAHG